MKKMLYKIINIIVLIVTGFFLFKEYRYIGIVFFNMDLPLFLIEIVTVCLVHFIKASRLYFMLFENEIGLRAYISTYSKVASVSVLLPYKIGDLFRMYCFGVQLGNYVKGIVTILMDRFMDTIALLTLLAFARFFVELKITFLSFVLIIFLMFSFIIYVLLPGICLFWKEYLLKSRANKRSIWLLSMLQKLMRVFIEARYIVRGRGIILYVMSLLSWIIEIGSLAFVNLILGKSYHLREAIAEYLLGSLGGKVPDELYMLQVFLPSIGVILFLVKS